MAGSSTYPTSVDNKTAIQDGVDYMEADNINNAYVPLTATQTFIGSNGKGASWSTDMLEYLGNLGAPKVTKSSATALSVSAGSVFIKDSGQTNRLMRRNTIATGVTIANLDTGTIVSTSTYYYVYAVADSAATTFTVKISTSASSPTGLTNYELIGWFYNETGGAALDITTGYVGNVKGGGRNVPNAVTVAGTSDITTSSTSYIDMTDMTVRFYTSGRPVLITFSAPFATDTQSTIFGGIAVDATSKITGKLIGPNSETIPIPLMYLEALSAGTHTITAQWKAGSAANAKQNGSTDAPRRLIVVEL